jgi:2-polyprenyl-3-methyl-5-hydroxy-6-metoxy-1,4-benzoquinol methylase
MAPTDWENFCDATQKQRNMYEDWINAICGFLPDLSGLTMVDVACNSGYFPASFSLRGAKEAHGYDMTDFSGSFDLLNAVTGSQAVFHHASYDSMGHSINGIGEHDIVIASAIMEHISDPLYFLSFVSSVCRKLLFLFMPVIDTGELAITFNETKSRHAPDAKFPACFDSVKLSAPLIYKSLELCGFKKVVELYHRDSWIPMSFYKSRRVFIALR